MAAQAGVVYFDRRPTDEACREVAAGLAPIAPDGVSAFAHAGAVLAHGACHVWAGERTSRQPRQSSSGLVMTWDGRLDNRDDLCLTLGHTSSRDASDAAIALAVFERWGIEGLGRLIGDWSLVIWDGRRRTLYFARDYMGVRPLYYYGCRGRFVAWSSSLGELASRVGCVDAIDERFIARFMALRHSTDVMPYEGVHAVPTAHCVSVSVDRIETRRVWNLEPAVVRYRDPRLYEERLRALWTEAVGTRLRAEGTAWAELSGGLDSSSVVCMADVLINDKRVDAAAIQPISHVPAGSPEGDERRFIAAVEDRIGTKSRLLILDDHREVDDAAADWATPLAAHGVGLALVQYVREHGGRLVLSGRVGDAVMGCLFDNSVAVFDDVADRRWLKAAAGMRQWSRATRKPFIEIGWQLARERLSAAFPAVRPAALSETQQRGAYLLSSRLRSLAEALPDDTTAAVASAFPPSKRALARQLLGYSGEARLSIPAPPLDITYAYPFIHRPLVEFVLAIPGEELSAPGRMRSLMRRSFAELLPPRVVQRTSKGYYPPTAMRTLRPRAQAARPVDRLEVVRRGWLDPERLDAAIRDVIDGGAAAGAEVRRALRLEQWLTSRDRRGPAVTPKQKGGEHHDVLNA
ncbi:MAG: Asparagine synthetase [Acidobacteria bacterium]|nr:Asparagine synthetase [Acidobacteriota bacterium]